MPILTHGNKVHGSVLKTKSPRFLGAMHAIISYLKYDGLMHSAPTSKDADKKNPEIFTHPDMGFFCPIHLLCGAIHISIYNFFVDTPNKTNLLTFFMVIQNPLTVKSYIHRPFINVLTYLLLIETNGFSFI